MTTIAPTMDAVATAGTTATTMTKGQATTATVMAHDDDDMRARGHNTQYTIHSLTDSDTRTTHRELLVDSLELLELGRLRLGLLLAVHGLVRVLEHLLQLLKLRARLLVPRRLLRVHAVGRLTHGGGENDGGGVGVTIAMNDDDKDQDDDDHDDDGMPKERKRQRRKERQRKTRDSEADREVSTTSNTTPAPAPPAPAPAPARPALAPPAPPTCAACAACCLATASTIFFCSVAMSLMRRVLSDCSAAMVFAMAACFLLSAGFWSRAAAYALINQSPLVLFFIILYY
jgi:hypothetical protein